MNAFVMFERGAYTTAHTFYADGTRRLFRASCAQGVKRSLKRLTCAHSFPSSEYEVETS